MSTDNSEPTPALGFGGSWAYDSLEAGTLAVAGQSEAPRAIGLTTHGIAIGPIELSAYTDSTAKIKDLQYGAQESGFFDGWGSDSDSDWFASGAAGAAVASTAREPDEANPIMSRRNLLLSGGIALLGASYVSASEATAESQISVARFELTDNPGGLRVRVRDIAPDFLPTDAIYYVMVDGMDYAEFQGGGQSGDIPPIPQDGSWNVEIQTDAPDLMADVRRHMGEKELEYRFTLAQRPSEASIGTRLTITDHPMIREATLRAGADATTLEVGDEAVPHQSESRSNEVGWYGVRDGEVVLNVGPDPPSDNQAVMTVYAGILEETINDAEAAI